MALSRPTAAIPLEIRQQNNPICLWSSLFFTAHGCLSKPLGYGDVTIVRLPEKCITDDSINESMTDASYLAEGVGCLRSLLTTGLVSK